MNIAARLAGAAESDAKQDMIEELAENLVGRYQDMTAAGIQEEEAYTRAMDELGDADELDTQPFKAELKSTSGDVDFDPPQIWSWHETADPAAEMPFYRLNSNSGDVELNKA